jgi:mono/diheme cytochrome c family protein
MLIKNGATMIVAALLTAAIVSIPASGKKDVKDNVAGAAIFAQNCAKCHVGGGNIVKSSKPVVGSSQLANLATFKSYLSSPPGHMPYYQQIVTDKKKLESLYDFCKALKDVPPPRQACLPLSSAVD